MVVQTASVRCPLSVVRCRNRFGNGQRTTDNGRNRHETLDRRRKGQPVNPDAPTQSVCQGPTPLKTTDRLHLPSALLRQDASQGSAARDGTPGEATNGPGAAAG